MHDYLNYLVILVIAWFPSVANAYFGYRWFVFRSKGSIVRELPRFSLVYIGTLIMGLIALPILLRILPFSIYVTQALYTAVMVVASYLSHKYFSFSKRPRTLATPGEQASRAVAAISRRRRVESATGDGHDWVLQRSGERAGAVRSRSATSWRPSPDTSTGTSSSTTHPRTAR